MFVVGNGIGVAGDAIVVKVKLQEADVVGGDEFEHAPVFSGFVIAQAQAVEEKEAFGRPGCSRASRREYLPANRACD